MNEFSKRLRLLREKADLSLDGLSDKVDMAKSLLWRYENGKSEPGLSALTALAQYFGVTLDWIAGNGDIDEIQYKSYADAINKCVDNNISPSKLNKIIDAMKEE